MEVVKTASEERRKTEVMKTGLHDATLVVLPSHHLEVRVLLSVLHAVVRERNTKERQNQRATEKRNAEKFSNACRPDICVCVL
jgi:hypothetical protein